MTYISACSTQFSWLRRRHSSCNRRRGLHPEVQRRERERLSAEAKRKIKTNKNQRGGQGKRGGKGEGERKGVKEN